MSTNDHERRTALSRALIDADPDTPIEDLHQLLDSVPRWECQHCGRTTLSRSAHCGNCGREEFEKIEASDGGDGDD